MTEFYFPTPTVSPFTDIEPYKELLLAAIEQYLDIDSTWTPGDEITARDFMEELKEYVINLSDTTANEGDIAVFDANQMLVPRSVEDVLTPFLTLLFSNLPQTIANQLSHSVDFMADTGNVGTGSREIDLLQAYGFVVHTTTVNGSISKQIAVNQGSMNGWDATLLCKTTPSSGNLLVKVNGVDEVTIDLYSAAVVRNVEFTFSVPVPDPITFEPITIEMRSDGTKNASSSGYDLNITKLVFIPN